MMSRSAAAWIIANVVIAGVFGARPALGSSSRSVIVSLANLETFPDSIAVTALGDSTLVHTLQAAGATFGHRFHTQAQLADSIFVMASGDTLPLSVSPRLYRFDIDSTQSESDVAASLSNQVGIGNAEPGSGIVLRRAPNDPLYQNGSQYQLNNHTSPGNDLHAEQAWDYTIGDNSVVVAIIDSGTLPGHTDLSNPQGPLLLPGRNEVRGTTGAAEVTDHNELDPIGHGVAVQGLIAAVTDNGNGTGGGEIAGTMWKATIAPLKVTDDNLAAGPQPQDPLNNIQKTHVAQAMDDAVNMFHADVVNTSFSSAGYCPAPCEGHLIIEQIPLPAFWCHWWYPDVLEEASFNVFQRGALIVAPVSADFGATQTACPARSPWVLAVGAVDRNMALLQDLVNEHIDLVAPARNLVSTTRPFIPGGGGSLAPDGSAGPIPDGMSFAVAQVSGAAGLVISEGRKRGLSLTNEDVAWILRNTATRLGTSERYNAQRGFGMVNAGAAVAALECPNVFESGALDGGTVVETVNVGSVHWYQGAGITPEVYYQVTRYKVLQHIAYSSDVAPFAWGRSRGTRGVANEGGGSSVTGWTYVDNVTASGLDVYTYVYHAGMDAASRSVDLWMPCRPEQVRMQYGILGHLQFSAVNANVSRSGPDQVGLYTLQANAVGGDGVFNYTWEYRDMNPYHGMDPPVPPTAWQPAGTGPSIPMSTSPANGDRQVRLTLASAAGCLGGTFLNCIPSSPANPTVTISGPDRRRPGATGTWQAVAYYGQTCGDYAWAWKWRPAGGTWSSVASTAPSVTLPMVANGDMELSLVVTAAGATSQNFLVHMDDISPPTTVTDLAVEFLSTHQLWVSWSAPSDAGFGSTGKASEYDLRYSDQAITDEASFGRGSSLATATGIPRDAGEFEQAGALGLECGTRYYFAMKSVDAAGNWSLMSNVTYARTRSTNCEDPDPPPPFSLVAGTGAGPSAVVARKVKYHMVWTVASLPWQLSIVGATDSTAADSFALQRTLGGRSEADTAIVPLLNEVEAGIALRARGERIEFGSTWYPVSLSPVVAVAGAEGSSMRISRVLRRSASGEVIVGSQDWIDAPGSLGAGDTMLVEYVRGDTADVGSEEWFVVKGDPSQVMRLAQKGSTTRQVQRQYRLAIRWLGPTQKGRFEVQLPRRGGARLEFFDLAGRRVRAIDQGMLEAGIHMSEWDGHNGEGGNLARGVYLCRLETDGGSAVAKFVW